MLEHLKEDQINKRLDDTSWSIAQTSQHIAMVEAAVAKAIALGLTQEANFSSQALSLEESLLDRSQKIQSPTKLKPSSEPKTKEKLVAILNQSHAQFIHACSTKDIALF